MYPDEINKLAYGAGTSDPGMAMQERMPTYAENIERQVVQMEKRLADLKRIQEILAENPKFEELLTLTMRNGLYR